MTDKALDISLVPDTDVNYPDNFRYIVPTAAEKHVDEIRLPTASSNKRKLLDTLLVSIALHLVFLATLLWFTPKAEIKSPNEPLNEPLKIRSVKSYLYQPKRETTQPNTEAVQPKTEVDTQETPPQPEVDTQPVTKANAPEPAQEPLPVDIQDTVPAPSSEVTISKNDVPPKALTESKRILTSEHNKGASIAKRALSNLNKLNGQLDRKAMNDAASAQYQTRSLSSMHPNPDAVPHSQLTLTPDQLEEQNTERMHDSLSITKTDNGVCIMKEGLSDIGIEGVTATSAFKCGSTKEERWFKQHMEKVRKKIGK
ncbi:MAG: hypothetical protein MK214_05090 [Thalassotalea sp.]|nr:hypothetical protein [Thalassotalea sp.]